MVYMYRCVLWTQNDFTVCSALCTFKLFVLLHFLLIRCDEKHYAMEYMFPMVCHISYTSGAVLSFREDGQGQPSASATIIGMALGLAVGWLVTSVKVGFVCEKFIM